MIMSNEESPSGKYKVVVLDVETPAGCIGHSRGEVFRAGDPAPIAVVDRNYCWSTFAWIEGHPNGHDYLVCGEDYQGQTVIELDTCERRDHLPVEAKNGAGFCWTDARFDAATLTLVAAGCIWAAPFEYRFYDFSDPISGWPEIELDTWIYFDSKWPTVDQDGSVRCYETEDTEEDEEGDGERAPPIEKAVKTFRRDGHKLVLLGEWVSDAEKIRRETSKQNQIEHERWTAEFKATDPLYIAYVELVKDPALSPEPYEGRGVTHGGWCPNFTEMETRWCRRIVRKDKDKHPYTIDLEWAVKTGPVKLQVFKGGERSVDTFFEHSVDGLKAAFAAAVELVR
jgi:hypothetical protein